MKKYIKILILFFLFISFIGCSFENKNSHISIDTEGNEPDYIKRDKEYLESIKNPSKIFYIRDVKTQELTKLEKTYPAENGIINHLAYFGQTDPKEYEYELLVFVDSIQHNFIVDGKQYESYPFILKNTENIYIDLTLDVSNENANEVEYVFIQHPNFDKEKQEYLLNYFDGNLAKYLTIMTDITRPLVWKVKLTDNPIEKNKKYEEKFSSKDLLINTDFFNILNEPINEEGTSELLISATSNEKAYLTLTNEEKEEVEISLIAILNNKQIPFSDGDIIKTFKIDPESHLEYEFSFPEVEKDSIFQFISIPKPFQNLKNIDENKYFRLSHKIILNP